MKRVFSIILIIGFVFFSSCQKPVDVSIPSPSINNPDGEAKDNLFFFKRDTLHVTYSGSFLFEDVVQQEVKLNVNEIAKLKSGKLYELKLDFVEGVPDDRLSLGYFYVTNDKIYKLESTEENLNMLKESEELPEGSVVVCQHEELKDNLSEDETGYHYYIEVDGDVRKYHAFNNQVSTGYYETFVWEKDKGLVSYRSGYGAEANSIELQLNGSKTSIASSDTYTDYLASLPFEDFRSVGKACKEFKARVSKDKSINDAMFKEFYDFYQKVLNQIGEKSIDADEAELNENGFRTMTFEEGIYKFSEPDYFKNNFMDYVSENLSKFIEVDYTDKMIGDGGFWITDALLCIDRDTLSDIIIDWENYIKKYPQIGWTIDIANRNIKYYIMIYTDIELMSFSDMRGETKREADILRSYQRFIQRYPDSDNYKLIKEYYQTLKQNGVKKTETTTDLLRKYGVTN